MAEELLPWVALILSALALIVLAVAGWLVYHTEGHAREMARGQADFADLLQARMRDLRVIENGLGALLDQARKAYEGMVASPTWASRDQAELLLLHVTDLVSRQSAPAAPAQERGDSHEREVEQMQVRAQRTTEELLGLRQQFEQSQQEMGKLRRANRAVDAAVSTSDRLRQTNEQLMIELKSTRRQRREMEGQLEPMMLELRSVRAQLQALARSPVEPGADPGAAVQAAADGVDDVYRGRMTELESRLADSDRTLMALKDELARTLREKSFVEERFIEALEQAEAPAAPAEPATMSQD